MGIHRELKDRFPTTLFDKHDTDLYVLDAPGMRDWLRDHYDYFGNVVPFISNEGMGNGSGEL